MLHVESETYKHWKMLLYLSFCPVNNTVRTKKAESSSQLKCLVYIVLQSFALLHSTVPIWNDFSVKFFSSTLTQSRRAELRHELSKALPHG